MRLYRRRPLEVTSEQGVNDLDMGIFSTLATFSPIYPRSALAYSFLSASIGEIDAARRAGMTAAKNADIASVAAATAKANGSQLETP